MRCVCLVIAVSLVGCSSGGQSGMGNKEASDTSVELWRLDQEEKFLSEMIEVGWRFGTENAGWFKFEEDKWKAVREKVRKENTDKAVPLMTKYKVQFHAISDFSKDRERKRAEIEASSTFLKTHMAILKSSIDLIRLQRLSQNKPDDVAAAECNKVFEKEWEEAKQHYQSQEGVIKFINP